MYKNEYLGNPITKQENRVPYTCLNCYFYFHKRLDYILSYDFTHNQLPFSR